MKCSNKSKSLRRREIFPTRNRCFPPQIKVLKATCAWISRVKDEAVVQVSGNLNSFISYVSSLMPFLWRYHGQYCLQIFPTFPPFLEI